MKTETRSEQIKSNGKGLNSQELILCVVQLQVSKLGPRLCRADNLSQPLERVNHSTPVCISPVSSDNTWELNPTLVDRWKMCSSFHILNMSKIAVFYCKVIAHFQLQQAESWDRFPGNFLVTSCWADCRCPAAMKPLCSRAAHACARTSWFPFNNILNVKILLLLK